MKLKADRALQLHQRMILSSMSIILLGSSGHTQGIIIRILIPSLLLIIYQTRCSNNDSFWNNIYSFHITVIPPTPQVDYSTSTQVQIKVPYYIAYNVSLLVSSCGQYNVTAFFNTHRTIVTDL